MEGKDLEVLQSNDWSLFRPSFVLAEALDSDTFVKVLKEPVTGFMSKQGYEPIAKTLHTVLFKNRMMQ